MAWKACAFFLGAALTAATTACRPERASVEELYTTRMLGVSYLQRNQLPEAEAEFKKLTELAPDDPLGYANLGLTYLQAGRYDEAEKQLRRARKLDPASSEVGLMLARLYSLTGRPADARAMLELLRRDTTIGTILAGAGITVTSGGIGTFNGRALAKAAVAITGGTLTGCTGGSLGGTAKPKCNQGVSNGPEGCDPGNSNQGDPSRSNDELGGTPGNPGRKGGNGK